MKTKLKTRSEFEMEKLLQKYRVLARKEQIELVKLDNEIPFTPLDISQYQTPKRQIHFLKVLYSYLKYWTLLVKELKP